MDNDFRFASQFSFDGNLDSREYINNEQDSWGEVKFNQAVS